MLGEVTFMYKKTALKVSPLKAAPSERVQSRNNHPDHAADFIGPMSKKGVTGLGL